MGCMEKLAVVETFLLRICNQIKLGMWGVEAEASLPRNHPSRLFPLIWQKQHHWHSLVSCTTMVFSPCTHTKDSNVGHTRYLVCGPEMYLVEDAFWASSSTKDAVLYCALFHDLVIIQKTFAFCFLLDNTTVKNKPNHSCTNPWQHRYDTPGIEMQFCLMWLGCGLAASDVPLQVDVSYTVIAIKHGGRP